MQSEDFRNLAVSHIGENRSSLRDILRVLFQHKWKIISFFIGIVAAVTVGTYLTEETYESNAKLLIRVGRESVSVDPSVIGPTINLSQNREREVNSELAILQSRFIAKQVVDKIGPESFFRNVYEGHSEPLVQEELYNVRKPINQPSHVSAGFLVKSDIPPPPLILREDAISMVMDNLTVEVEQDSNIINLSFQAQGPSLARDTLDSLMDFYQDRHIRIYQAQASPKFFSEQSERLLAILAEKEEQLDQFCKKHAIVSIDGQKQALLGQISRLQSNSDDVNGQISSTQAKIVWLERNLQGRSSTIELNRVTGRTNVAADRIKERLTDLRLREADLTARYPEDSRLLTDLREQIKLAEFELAKEQETRTEITTGLDSNYQAMQLASETERSQLQALIAQKQSLEEETEKRKTELATLAGYEVTLTRLQREVDIAENEHRRYRDNLQRANISAALDLDKVSNVSIVQSATMPIFPVGPHKRRNIAMGILIGIFGGIALAFFIEYFDDSLKTTEDVKKRLNLPVLASVSHKKYFIHKRNNYFNSSRNQSLPMGESHC